MPLRPSPTRRWAAAALALALGAAPAAADPLVIDADGTVRIGPPSGEPLTVAAEQVKIGKPVSFGQRLATLMTLYETGYTIGIQAMTMYFRTDENFAWFMGGNHDGGELAAGGGRLLMSLSSAPAEGKGTLDVNGSVTATGITAAGPIAGTTLSAGAVTVEGGISAKSAVLVLDPRTDAANHPSELGSSFYVTGTIAEGVPASSSAGSRMEFRHSNGTQGIGFGYNTIYATGSIADQPLRLRARGSSNVAIVGNGNLEVPGTLYLGSGWSAAASGTTLRFSKDGSVIMALNSNERLQYKMPGSDGLYYLASGNYGWAWWEGSDARLKDEIAPIPGALRRLRALSGVSFRWNAQAIERFAASLEPPGAGGAAQEEDLRGLNFGVIAQDVEAVLPEAVRVDADGYRSVRYRDLIPLLIEAAKEQDAIVAAQAARLAELEAEVARLAAAARPTPAALSAH